MPEQQELKKFIPSEERREEKLKSSVPSEVLAAHLKDDTCTRLVWSVLDSVPSTKGDYRLLWKYCRERMLASLNRNAETRNLSDFEKERLMYSTESIGRCYRYICDDWCHATLGMSYAEVRANSAVWLSALKMPHCPLPLPRTIAKREANERVHRAHFGEIAAQNEANEGNTYVEGSG